MTNIQSIAGKWQTALTAILGLLSVTALIGGRDALQKLSSDAQERIGVAAAISVGTSVLAILLFAYASSGAPRFRALNGPEALVNADLRPLKAAWFASTTFFIALFTAVVSLVAVCVAVGYVWYGDPAPTAEKVQIVIGDGTGGSFTLCGEIEINARGQISIEPGANGAEASSFPASRVRSIGTC